MEKLEFKGTKGKFIPRSRDEHGVFITEETGAFAICRVFNSSHITLEQFTSNTNLLSSAPDLLEALQHIIPVFEQLASYRNLEVDNLECYKKSIKAIEKALK